MTAEVPPPSPLLGTGHCSRILRLTPHLRPRPEAPAPLTGGGGGGGEKSDDDDGCGREGEGGEQVRAAENED